MGIVRLLGSGTLRTKLSPLMFNLNGGAEAPSASALMV